jgi:uncharacterized protein YdaU (DUF1376 family)
MAEFPKMPLWTDAYMGDTGHLTTIEHGAYLLLLITMWRNKGTLPADDRLLAKYTRLTATQWARIRPVIMPFFKLNGGVLSQGRLTDEYNAVRQHSAKQSDRAKARWLKTNDTPDATAVPKESQNDATLSLPQSPTLTPKGVTESLSDPAFDLFNEFAARAGWPSCQKRTKPRASAISARVKEAGGLDGWRVALEKAEASDFLCNRTRAGFTASIDFLLQASSFAKLMEGNYDNRANTKGTGRPGVHDGLLQAASAVARGERSRFE